MTFFMVAGIVSIITSVVLILIFILIRRIDENSMAAKIVMWVGMMFSVAGASLLTIEYMFPNISHPEPPYVPTVYDHFVEFYSNKYIDFIKETKEHEPSDILKVTHTQLKTKSNEEYSITSFKTFVIYEANELAYEISILNEYQYTADYSYQNIIAKEIK